MLNVRWKSLNCAYPKNVVFAEMCNYCSTKTVSQNVYSSPDKKVALEQKLRHGYILWLFSFQVLLFICYKFINFLQTYPNMSTSLHNYPNISTSLQNYPNISTSLQNYPNISTSLQNNSNISTSLQNYPNISTSLHTNPNISTSLQNYLNLLLNTNNCNREIYFTPRKTKLCPLYPRS